jgi:hypothetical protein
MVTTFIMLLVLILSFAAMFGVVRFAENVIAKPRLAPLNGDTAKAPAVSVEPL